ncbi:MAG: CDP-glucose 4,6-dehydratase, partial [Chitinophagaceae bacterium]
ASKACTELVVNSFRSSFFNIDAIASHQKTIATARAGNVIGGGDWNKDRLIPDIIQSLSERSAIEVRNPCSIRPWQHVLEPLTGYLLLAASLQANPMAFSRAYNFGPLPGDHLTVQQLADTAIAAWGDGAWIDVSMPGQLHEAGILKLDINRAMNDLGWYPKMNAVKAIEWTINWYKKPLSQQLDYTLHQINQYLSI